MLYAYEVSKLKQFTLHIKACPNVQFVQIKTPWTDGVCNNRVSCFKKELVGYTLFFRWAKCGCKKEYSFVCDNHYCGKDKLSCEQFLLNRSKPIEEFKKINKCQ